MIFLAQFYFHDKESDRRYSKAHLIEALDFAGAEKIADAYSTQMHNSVNETRATLGYDPIVCEEIEVTKPLTA